MRIAVSARGPALSSGIDPCFDRADYVVVIDTSTGELSAYDNWQIVRSPDGADTLAARDIVNYGVDGLITGNITPDAANVLYFHVLSERPL